MLFTDKTADYQSDLRGKRLGGEGAGAWQIVSFFILFYFFDYSLLLMNLSASHIIVSLGKADGNWAIELVCSTPRIPFAAGSRSQNASIEVVIKRMPHNHYRLNTAIFRATSTSPATRYGWTHNNAKHYG